MIPRVDLGLGGTRYQKRTFFLLLLLELLLGSHLDSRQEILVLRIVVVLWCRVVLWH